MNVARAGTPPIQRGPAEWFSGTVWLDDLAGAAPVKAGFRAFRVTFEPGARTAWHTHPHGQTLHILSGVGRVGRADGETVEVFPGDSVWFEPGERHWHGAAPNHVMSHLAVQPTDEAGSSAAWFEQVSDTDYRRGETAPAPQIPAAPIR